MSRKKAKNRYGRTLLTEASKFDCSPETVRRLIPLCRIHERNVALCKAARNGNLAVVLELIPRCDARADDSKALRLATMYGHLDVVNALIPVSDVAEGNNRPLFWAAVRGHIEIVRALIPFSDPTVNNNSALSAAAERGNLKIAQMLVPLSDPKANHSEALRRAAAAGHREMVAALIPVSDAKANNSQALRTAAEYGHVDVIGMLLPLSDAVNVLRELLNALVEIVRQHGIEEVKQQQLYHPPLREIKALIPHLEDDFLDRAVLDLPAGLANLLPRLCVRRDRIVVREATAPYAAATPCRRRSL